jgi:hypothetical protein
VRKVGYLNDLINRVIGLVQSGFDGAVGLQLRMRAMRKEAVGQGCAPSLREEHEQHGDFHALGGEAV